MSICYFESVEEPPMIYLKHSLVVVFSLLISLLSVAQVLPPGIPWVGSSIVIMQSPDDIHATPFEKSNGTRSATPAELALWIEGLKGLANVSSRELCLSAQGHPVYEVRVSTETGFREGKASSNKPVLLFHGGIHAGEIDGLDAGMLLVRDLNGGRLRKYLERVNIIFIPVLNPDGHARLSHFNRINQRGPEEMGWRSNSLNQNLNRDFTKLDTREIQSLMQLIRDTKPDLYIDIHVTDGADYQYDITYGWLGEFAYSPSISNWLNRELRPATEKALTQKGHIPGPLVFFKDESDVRQGNLDYAFSPRFSHSWGNASHVPSILVENHSLKPFKQRVLGSYVFLESCIDVLSEKSTSLKAAIEKDKAHRTDQVVIQWKIPETTQDSVVFKAISSKKESSTLTGMSYTTWTGKPELVKIPVFQANQVEKSIVRPKEYIIPAHYKDVISRLKMYGVVMQELTNAEVFDLSMYRIENPSIQGKLPFQGRVRISATFEQKQMKQTFPKGSVRISTDQALGNLVCLLLEPESTDSYFQWGFFSGCLERTEYFENYAMVPMAELLAKADPKLLAAYESKLNEDLDFANNPEARLRWWYEHSEYIDATYLIYPVGKIN